MTFNDNAQLDTSQATGGGGGGLRPGGIAVGGGAGGILMLIIFVVMQLLGGGGGGGSMGGSNMFDPAHVAAADGAAASRFDQCKTGADANKDDTCRVIGTTNAVQNYWASALGDKYKKIQTVIFTGAVNTGCGQATSEVGPFYCPMDQRVYIDTNFYKELQKQFGAQGGPLAKSYVIAHEYGHHVQNLAGVLGRAQEDPKGATSGAVRTELQADCYAGVWMAHITEAKDANGTPLFKPLTEDQVLDAQNAASVIGDDHIQETMRGRVTPENFTHGTSAQRQKWLLHGFTTGDPRQCDTYNAADLG